MRKSAAIVLGLLLATGVVCAQQYLITTVAGGGLPPTPAQATSASFGSPGPVAADGLGNIYFTTANCVFKVDAAGMLTRVAGRSAVQGYAGDGGPATEAQLNNPQGVALDAAGNLYIADLGNSVIRRVAPNGIITTVAGDGSGAYAIAVDAAGNLYVAAGGANLIRTIAPSGATTIVAGNGDGGYSGDGGPATAARLFGPYGVAVDATGNLYIADSGNHAIRKVAADGTIATVAGNGTAGYAGDGWSAANALLDFPYSVAVDAAGNLYIADFSNNVIRKVGANGMIATVAGTGAAGYSGDGGPATSARLSEPGGVALGAGSLYITDFRNSVIRKVANGGITTVAGNGIPGFSGDGGPATSAQLSWPSGEAVDSAGNLYIADTNNNAIRRVAADGSITTVAGKGTPGYSGDGGQAAGAQVSHPWGVALDGNGNLFIADSGNFVIRKLAPNGVITTVAGNGTPGYSGDGGPATRAQLGQQIYGLAADAAGNLYIPDAGNSVIRKVDAASGIITTLAGRGTRGYSGDGGPATSAQLNQPYRVAVDTAGNVFVADFGNAAIRLVAPTGIITTVAGNGTWGTSGDGGPATSAQLDGPWGIAVDAAGNLYIGDWTDGLVRKVAAATCVITTIAGNVSGGNPGNGGPATAVQVSPEGLAVDAAGNVYVADSGSNVIWMLTPQPALLALTTTPSASFFESGQMGASYSIVLSNTAGAGETSGMVTMTEIPPAGVTLVSMSGAGWNCSGATCTRRDVLAPGSAYPPVIATVNVAPDAPAAATNHVDVVGGFSPAVSSTLAMWILSQPTPPVLASPTDGATAVLTAPTLTWGAEPGPTSYDVYFGTSAHPPLVATTTGTTYAPGTLTAQAAYYWRIVARNEIGSASSATWSFTTGVPPVGTRFVPVPPCRVADTRRPAGPFGGPTMTAGSTRSFSIPGSGCGIPATAQAYSVNVTVVPAGPLSFLTLWPAGQAQPFVSTLNSMDGSVVANAAIVPAGLGGAVNTFVSNQTDVILDINGYFDSDGASFYAATPCRVADTRHPTGQFGGPSMFATETRDFPIPSGACAVPATATAYSLNVTAVPQAGFLGYLTAWPTGPTRPPVSTLNSWTGEVVANAAIVPAGTNESISVFATDPTDVILDLNGYFGPSAGEGALDFYPVPPCRVADTRYPAGPFGGPEIRAESVRSFAIPASGCAIPSTAVAYSVNITVVPDGPLSYLTAWGAGSPQPNVSTLNSLDGGVVANAAIVPAGTNGAISIYVTNGTHVVLDINGYFGQ